MADVASGSAAITTMAFEASNTLASAALVVRNKCGVEINLFHHINIAGRVIHGPSPLGHGENQVVTMEGRLKVKRTNDHKIRPLEDKRTKASSREQTKKKRCVGRPAGRPFWPTRTSGCTV